MSRDVKGYFFSFLLLLLCFNTSASRRSHRKQQEQTFGSNLDSDCRTSPTRSNIWCRRRLSMTASKDKEYLVSCLVSWIPQHLPGRRPETGVCLPFPTNFCFFQSWPWSFPNQTFIIALAHQKLLMNLLGRHWEAVLPAGATDQMAHFGMELWMKVFCCFIWRICCSLIWEIAVHISSTTTSISSFMILSFQ